jgi:hypothetical protein
MKDFCGQACYGIGGNGTEAVGYRAKETNKVNNLRNYKAGVSAPIVNAYFAAPRYCCWGDSSSSTIILRMFVGRVSSRDAGRS